MQTSSQKIICLIPTKNEDWILERTLSALSLFADVIIVGDGNSSDKTLEICKNFSKVIVIENNRPNLSSVNRRQIMLDESRKYGTHNIVCCFDADEIPTAEVLSDSFWNEIKQLAPGTSVNLEWITLWKSPRTYAQGDTVWAGQYKPFIFCDDGITNFTPGDVHEGRVPEGFDIQAKNIESVKVLHYQFVLWERMLSKQALIRVLEMENLGRNPFFINFRYGITKDERGVIKTDIPGIWYKGYEKHGLDIVKDFKKNNVLWQDREVLRYFFKNGCKKYKWLDIWDIPWEQKRVALVESGEGVEIEEKLVDPRNMFIRLYHWVLSKINIIFLIELYGKYIQVIHAKKA